MEESDTVRQEAQSALEEENQSEQLQTCLNTAQATYTKGEGFDLNYAKNNCTEGEVACDAAAEEGITNLANQLQIDKDNCFKEYPQN